METRLNRNRVYVLGHKYVLGPSQTHFSPRLAARAKMSPLSRGSKHIYAREHKLYCYIRRGWSYLTLLNAKCNLHKICVHKVFALVREDPKDR